MHIKSYYKIENKCQIREKHANDDEKMNPKDDIIEILNFPPTPFIKNISANNLDSKFSLNPEFKTKRNRLESTSTRNFTEPSTLNEESVISELDELHKENNDKSKFEEKCYDQSYSITKSRRKQTESEYWKKKYRERKRLNSEKIHNIQDQNEDYQSNQKSNNFVKRSNSKSFERQNSIKSSEINRVSEKKFITNFPEIRNIKLKKNVFNYSQLSKISKNKYGNVCSVYPKENTISHFLSTRKHSEKQDEIFCENEINSLPAAYKMIFDF